jgi:hypothetical protein
LGPKHLFLGLFGSLQLWLKPETFEPQAHHHACLSFLFTGGRGRRAIQNRSAENDKQVLTVRDGIEQRGSGIPN